MKEGKDGEEVYAALGLTALLSVEGFTAAELVEYASGDRRLADEIGHARLRSPELDEALQNFGAELSRREKSSRERDRRLDAIVAASLEGSDALTALIGPGEEPWFVDAVQRAIEGLRRYSTDGEAPDLVLESDRNSDAPASPARPARRAWKGLLLATGLAFGTFLWAVLRPTASRQMAQSGGSGRLSPPRAVPNALPFGGGSFPEYIARAIALYTTFPASLNVRDVGNVRPRPVELRGPNPDDASLVGLRPQFVCAPTLRKVEASLERIGSDGLALKSIRLSTAPGGEGWLPDAPLVPGALYRLSLAQTVDPLATELPEDARYVFRVLSGDERRAVVWADRNVSRRPKECAMVYYMAQRYADADRAARAAPKTAFSDARSLAWRERFATALRMRRADPSNTDLP